MSEIDQFLEEALYTAFAAGYASASPKELFVLTDTQLHAVIHEAYLKFREKK